MKKFTCVQDIGDLKSALAEAFEIQKDRFKYVELGRNKTLMMIFFNSSLRTRLSTQKAALNLGMNVMVLDINQGAWKLETERGVIMDGDKPEHLLEAIPVMGCYCDIIGVRSFARFEDRDFDYQETILNQFIQYPGRPVFSMEAATRHPLQSFADLITIEEYKKTARPKVVMTWAPHPRPLPQAVPNSFAEWMNATDYDFVITHPEGYELATLGDFQVEFYKETPLQLSVTKIAEEPENPDPEDPNKPEKPEDPDKEDTGKEDTNKKDDKKEDTKKEDKKKTSPKTGDETSAATAALPVGVSLAAILAVLVKKFK